MTQTTEQPMAANYPPALTSLTQNIMEATQQTAVLYQEHQLAMEPENFIRLYCRWLGFIVGKKITGDKDHLYQLISDTIQQYEEQGRNLCRMVTSHTDKDTTQIDKLVNTHGIIVVPVIKLTQFISQIIKQMLSAKPRNYTQEERLQLETTLEEPMAEIFANRFQAALQEINELQIPNPLIFLLEHFSITVGWLTGFFAQLSNKPTKTFLEKSLVYLQPTMQIETEGGHQIH
jgi:hypothetical protein